MNWASVEPVDKGWSADKKYHIKTFSNEHLLLRLSGIEEYDKKKKEFEIIEKYATLGFRMSMPIEFGACNGNQNTYMLLTWLEGCDLEMALPQLSENEQYQLGWQAGVILKKIHSVPLEEEEVPIKTKKEKKLLQLSKYEESGLRIPNDEIAIRYVKENIDQIWRKSPAYLHGDFHPGNLIYMQDASIGVIDFNRWEVGDPFEEFYKLESFGIESGIPYCIGQIDAYFDDSMPMDFWVANAVYVAQASLFSIKWAEKFGQQEIDGMVARAKRAFADFDDFKKIIPYWYSGNYRKMLNAEC